jgi:hypothetical protein
MPVIALDFTCADKGLIIKQIATHMPQSAYNLILFPAIELRLMQLFPAVKGFCPCHQNLRIVVGVII